MSGAEAIIVLGVIASIISIVDGTKQVFDAARNTQGLPEAFREVAGRLPIIANVLGSARRQIEQKKPDEESCKGVKQVLEACEKKAKELKQMFEKAIPNDGASRLQQYSIAVRTIGKASKVENLMKGMLEDVQLLASEHGFKTATEEEQKQITHALAALAAVPPSIPDSELQESSITATHTGVGDQYNARGEYIAQGSARQYISKGPMYFEKRNYNTTVSDPAVQSLDLETFFSTVPRLKVAHYVDRPKLHAQLEAGLHAVFDEKVEHSNVAVVHGLGGAGKTQLVLHYIQKYSGDYRGVFWISSGSQKLVESNMAMVYRILYKIPMVSEAEPLPAHEVLLRVKTWFSSRQDRWLLVFDGADSVTDMQDVDYIDLISLIPSAPSVHVLVTTRSSISRMTQSETISVSNLEPEQALELFWNACELQSTDLSQKNQTAAASIVKEVGCLALAIELAGATVSESTRMQADLLLYLSEYRSNQRELLERQPDRLITRNDKSILTAWETTFKHLNGRSPLAASMLGLFALLDPSDIYLELFETALKARSDSNEKRCLESSYDWIASLSSESAINIRQIEAGLAALTAFSLLLYDRKNKLYSMHKLVHEWSYQRLSRDDQARFCRASTDFLRVGIRHCGQDPKDRTRLMKHVSQSFQISSRRLDDLSEADYQWFMTQFETYFMLANSLGRWNECEMIGKFQCQNLVRRLGKEHPATYIAMGNLASTLHKQGKLEEAAEMQREVLEERRRILGEEHPTTITVINNLANTLYNQGKLEEAAGMRREVLEKSRRILGEEHPGTIAVTNNLANTLHNQGKLEEAAGMRREVLEKSRRILGEEHPDTIAVINNLANTLGDQGKLEEAAGMQREMLEKTRRILGEEHPDLITAMKNLAKTLGDQGRLEEAAGMQREVLEKRRRILGEEHPATYTAMGNLASTLRNQGKLEEAAGIQREVLEKTRRILGEEHLDTITAMNNLAKTLGDQGRPEEAAGMVHKAIQGLQQILGIEYNTISRS